MTGIHIKSKSVLLNAYTQREGQGHKHTSIVAWEARQCLCALDGEGRAYRVIHSVRMARFSTEVYATSNVKPASFRSLAERGGGGVKGNAVVSMTAGVSVKVLVLFD